MGDEKTPVTIRVDTECRTEWEEAMTELEMGGLAEYIRAMVAVGQKQFSEVPTFGDSESRSLQQAIKQELDAGSYTSWDELLDNLMEKIAVDAETILTRMEDADMVEHSPRMGGYKLNDD